MNDVELLAPAGNFECLKAAINNGANAVYLGGKNFSARAFANNFDENELIEAVKYAHLRNVKVYVTLNTLLNEYEIQNAIKMAKFYYDNNVDALLVQDLGLFYYLKTNFPDFELHCSTQMHVHNIEGIKTAKKLGFSRVVIPRESSLEFIKEACKQGIEIETFVHGAICVSYSGQCLMSSVTKNRSANKGMCAQCCRLKYELFDSDNNKIRTDTEYLLSPKDMCLLDDIQDLIKAGVKAFKIEGRMKSAAYVGYVTRLYRKAIDDPNYKISQDELNNLKVLFNRNFTNDYLYSKNDLFGQVTPNHLGIEIGETINYKNGLTYIKLNKSLNQFDGIRINDFGCIVNMMYKDDLLVNHGDINDVIAIKTDEKLIGKVYKTLDYQLENDIINSAELKLPINIQVNINPNNNVLININNEFEYNSEIIPMEALKAPLNYESINKQFSKLNDTIYYLNKLEVNTNNAFLPVKNLNLIRRQAIDAYNEFRLKQFKRYNVKNSFEYKDEVYFVEEEDLIQDDDLINDKYQMNYVINPDSVYPNNEEVVICEFGGLLKEYKDKIAYYTLNCFNSYCYEFYLKLGFKRIILSSELSNESIKYLIDGYKNRVGKDIKPYHIISGNRVLMYTKANPFDKYINDNKTYYLKDFNNTYLIRKNHNLTEIIEQNNSSNNNKQMFTNKY